MLDLLPAFPNASATAWTVLAVILALEFVAYGFARSPRKRRERKRALLAALLLVCVGAGWQPIAREILQRTRCHVTDFGADPTGVTDSSQAILDAIESATTTTGRVHFPFGTFLVDSDNVLHPQTAGVASGFGIQFTGDAQNHSIVKLKRSAGNTRWLYDSSSLDGWNRVQFSNLWFTSDLSNASGANAWNAAYCAEVNGFQIAARLATGVDKGFIFQNLRFNGFGTPLSFSGQSNTDSFNAFSCWWHNCGPIVFENDQTLLNLFWGCHFWSPLDTFHVKATAGMGQQLKGGGGAILVVGGDMINEAWGTAITAIAASPTAPLIRVTSAAHGYTTGEWVVISGASSATGTNNRWQVTRIDDNTLDLQGSTWAANGTSGTLSEGDTPYYTLRMDDGAAFARSFTFRDCRWESRQTWKSRVLHKRGASSFTFTNEVLFDGCDLSVNHGAESGATGREYLTLGGVTRATFRSCHLPERFGIGFYDCDTSQIAGFQYQPLVLLDACALGPSFVTNLATRITYDTGDTNAGAFGRVISNGGRSLTASGLTDNLAFDFDYGPVRGGRGEPGRTRKRISLKNPAQAWPLISAGTPASERTATLPPGTRVLNAGFSKPAAGATTTEVQYAIGKDDKSTIFALSPPYKASGSHKAAAGESTDPDLFPYQVGSSAETFRCWMVAPGVVHNNTGGDMWLEFE